MSKVPVREFTIRAGSKFYVVKAESKFAAKKMVRMLHQIPAGVALHAENSQGSRTPENVESK